MVRGRMIQDVVVPLKVRAEPVGGKDHLLTNLGLHLGATQNTERPARPDPNLAAVQVGGNEVGLGYVRAHRSGERRVGAVVDREGSQIGQAGRVDDETRHDMPRANRGAKHRYVVGDQGIVVHLSGIESLRAGGIAMPSARRAARFRYLGHPPRVGDPAPGGEEDTEKQTIHRQVRSKGRPLTQPPENTPEPI